MEKQFLLAGDIGGTKTILALFSRDKGPGEPLFEASYRSIDFPGLDEIITEFQSRAGNISAAIACFGVAGPVRDGRAVITKLPWQPDARQLREHHDFSRVTLINDLVATGYAIPYLAPSDFHVINKGYISPEGSLGVIAAGTGLGEALFTWEGSRYIAVPSEGGHSDFAPQNDIEIDLLRFLGSRYGHVSYDRICSGQGLPDIYDFFRENLKMDEPDWLKEELAVDDRTPVIVGAALDGSERSEICIRTLEMFVSILSAEAGNLALKGLTTGGMYLGGGILPRIIPYLQQETFMTSFGRKGRMSYLLEDMPVKVILNPKAALIGAASYGLGLKFVAAG